jgi:hypothetical protein
MSKPVVLVCGCERYREYLVAALRRLTGPEWELVGVVGGAAGAPVWDEATRIVALPVSDTYEALPTKIHAAFAFAAAKWPDAPGVYKTDDDIVYQSVPQLAKALVAYAAEPFWGLVTATCRAAQVNPIRIATRFQDTTLKPMHQGAAYCYGHGYWVGRQAIPAVIAAVADYQTSYLEDVCTGYVLNRAGYRPKRLPLAYSELPRGPALLNA